MYNVNDTDITINVTSIKSDERPIVTYPVKEEANAKWVTCKRFDLKKNTTTLSDTSTAKEKDKDNNEFINCTLSILGEVDNFINSRRSCSAFSLAVFRY